MFGDAECKFYLTASPEERARRRAGDFQAQGKSQAVESVLADINRRDREDVSRPVGPLVRPDDAVEISTDGLNVDQVVDRLEKIVRDRLAQVKRTTP